MRAGPVWVVVTVDEDGKVDAVARQSAISADDEVWARRLEIMERSTWYDKMVEDHYEDVGAPPLTSKEDWDRYNEWDAPEGCRHGAVHLVVVLVSDRVGGEG